MPDTAEIITRQNSQRANYGAHNSNSAMTQDRQQLCLSCCQLGHIWRFCSWGMVRLEGGIAGTLTTNEIKIPIASATGLHERGAAGRAFAISGTIHQLCATCYSTFGFILHDIHAKLFYFSAGAAPE